MAMPDTDPDNGSEVTNRPSDDTQADRPAAEAKRYLRRAFEQPEDAHREQVRPIELLSVERSTGRDGLAQRAAASSALAKLTYDTPASLEAFLPKLVEELRLETNREMSNEDRESLVVSRTVRDRLVWTIAYMIVNKPGTTVEKETFDDFVRSVTTDLDDRTLRVATQAMFASAAERSWVLASVAELLDELLAYPDTVVQAWGAGTVGRVAAEHPDEVAVTTANLRRLLTHDDTTVQHNAVEALAALVVSRPDTVLPAAGDLRALLAHEDVAIQHNAAGVFGRLAEVHPDAVIPAVEDLQDLRDHEDESVRRIATSAVTRLAREYPFTDW